MSEYKGYTKEGLKAYKKYMENFVQVKARMTPEKRDAIKKRAADRGESVNTFVLSSIERTIECDKERNDF